MKQTKMVIWAIIIVFIGLIIFQNQEFFLSKQILHLNIGIVDVYESPQVFVAIVFLVFFIFGVIIEYLFSLPERFRTNKMLKKLKAINTSLENELNGLKRDVAGLKGEPVETSEGSDKKTAEVSENKGAEKGIEAVADIPTDSQDKSLPSDTAAADPSESPADTANESRLDEADDSKKDGFADKLTKSSIEKNT